MSQWRNAGKHTHTFGHIEEWRECCSVRAHRTHSVLLPFRATKGKIAYFCRCWRCSFDKRHNSISFFCVCVRPLRSVFRLLQPRWRRHMHDRNRMLAKWFNKFRGFENWYKLASSMCTRRGAEEAATCDEDRKERATCSMGAREAVSRLSEWRVHSHSTNREFNYLRSVSMGFTAPRRCLWSSAQLPTITYPTSPVRSTEAQLINPHFTCENKIKCCRRQSARGSHRHGVYWQCNNPFPLRSGAGLALDKLSRHENRTTNNKIIYSDAVHTVEVSSMLFAPFDAAAGGVGRGWAGEKHETKNKINIEQWTHEKNIPNFYNYSTLRHLTDRGQRWIRVRALVTILRNSPSPRRTGEKQTTIAFKLFSECTNGNVISDGCSTRRY